MLPPGSHRVYHLTDSSSCSVRAPFITLKIGFLSLFPPLSLSLSPSLSVKHSPLARMSATRLGRPDSAPILFIFAFKCTLPPCHHATMPPCHHATMPPSNSY